MFRNIIHSCIRTLEKISKKKILIVDEKKVYQNKTAALSSYGFWYAGNIFDMSDFTYGIAMTGDLHNEETTLITKTLAYIAKNKKVVFYDIGANTGYYSILAGYLHTDATVYAFEPLSEHVDCIEKSIYLNHLTNIRNFTCALSDTEGEIAIYVAGTGTTLSKEFVGNNPTTERKITLKVFDTVVSTEKLEVPDFIKIDVEGHELKVLLGAKDTIEKNIPILYTEVIYSMKQMGRPYINEKYIETFDFLKQFGYEVYEMKDGILKIFNPKEKPDGVRMYLFLHPEKHTAFKNHILHEKFN